MYAGERFKLQVHISFFFLKVSRAEMSIFSDYKTEVRKEIGLIITGKKKFRDVKGKI